MDREGVVAPLSDRQSETRGMYYKIQMFSKIHPAPSYSCLLYIIMKMDYIESKVL